MDLKKLLILVSVVFAAAFMACGEETPEVEPEVVVDEAASTIEDTMAPIDPDDMPQPEMTEEEKMAYVMENCICPQCPSWIPEAAEKGEGGYCATGMSECIIDEVGCVCPTCPVTQEMGLEWGYYCTRGSAAEMMVEEE